MKRALLSVIVCFALNTTAKADIFDRIDRCEQTGGASGCVYDLLRELAQGGGGQVGILENGTYTANGKVRIYATQNAVSLKWVDVADRTDGGYTCSGFVCVHADPAFKITVTSPTTFTLTTADGYSGNFTKDQ